MIRFMEGSTMMARYLDLEARHRRGGGYIGSVEDFTVREGEEVDAGIVLSNPNLSLYTFDDNTKQAIFVELPDGVNLALSPFVYQTQYEQAQRLLAVPYADFRQIAKTLPPVRHLIMMYISGRSGSTLLSHVFNELDSVMSLSEPDVITQFVHLRDADHTRDAELRELADCTVRILFKPNPYKSPATYAIKFRMETVLAMDLFQGAFPHAKNLYLYRDAEGFVRSFYRVLKDAPEMQSMPVSDFLVWFQGMFNYDFSRMRIYLDPGSETISLIQLLTLWWMTGVEWYIEQVKRGIPALTVHYADLIAHRERVLAAIFEYCDLPVEGVSKALRAFDRDSQAGTVLARENPQEGNRLQLTDEQKQAMNRILARHPVIRQSDFIAPNTLRV
jgi:hypothetical protein